MSDIKSIFSGIDASPPLVATVKKPNYRPKSSSEPRTTKHTNFFERPTEIKNVRESKP
jgi:hypothetical protein